MNYPQKTIVAVNLNSDYKTMLAPLKDMTFLAQSEVHLVYIFPSISYGFVFEGTLSYPVPEEKHKVEAKVETLLSEFRKEFLGFHKGTVKNICLFAEKPSEKFTKYADEINADLAIVATRLSKGIFESSFATYQSKHLHSHLLVLRPH